MQKINPFLWFDHEAEEAARFYTSIFPDSKIKNVSRYGADGPGVPGSVMTVAFQIHGQDFIALNGGPQFQFTPAISFLVHCETQEEVDTLWEKLLDGGAAEQCGWLRDRLRRFLADRAHRARRDARRQGSGEGEARGGRDVRDAEARHRRIEASVRACIAAEQKGGQ